MKKPGKYKRIVSQLNDITVTEIATHLERWKQAYIDHMVDPYSDTSNRGLARLCLASKLPPKVLKDFRKDPSVQGEIRKKLREVSGYGTRLRELYDALFAKALTGYVPAIKLYFEICGEYIDKLEVHDKRRIEDLIDEEADQLTKDKTADAVKVLSSVREKVIGQLH